MASSSIGAYHSVCNLRSSSRAHTLSQAAKHAPSVFLSTVHRILVRHGVKPHLLQRFKVSTDPDFEKKTYDVTGLYMDPPDRAVVFLIDEKTQIQALGRTQKGLPMKPEQPATMTHDYKRNGTTTLFAPETAFPFRPRPKASPLRLLPIPKNHSSPEALFDAQKGA